MLKLSVGNGILELREPTEGTGFDYKTYYEAGT